MFPNSSIFAWVPGSVDRKDKTVTYPLCAAKLIVLPFIVVNGTEAGWTLNWISFLQVDRNGNVTVMVPGGGSEFYPLAPSGSQSLYKHNLMSHALLRAQPEGGFERILPDGSVEVYNTIDQQGRTFLSELQDPNGNAIRFGYDKWFRLRTVTDSIGQVSKIRYASESPGPSFLRIVEIEDPFGRKAKFTYDKAFAHLESTTDPIGLVSQFTYKDGTNTVSGINTAYGTTTFDQYVPPSSPTGSLGLRITHPDGYTTVTEHWTGNRRTTYQWNKLALQLHPDDPSKGIYTNCKIIKWASRPNGRELSIALTEKQPLESEVVYSYSGLSGKGFSGHSNLPTSISRRVIINNPDGTDKVAVQSQSFEYNEFGRTVRKVDPLGRITTYKYAPNGIDLIETRRAAANGDLIARFEYDQRHNQTMWQNFGGTIVRYKYNKLGQPTEVIDGENRSWTTVYDEKGYVIARQGPTSKQTSSERFDYDSMGRVKTKIDPDGHAFTFEYDNADRPLKKTFEDGTYEKVSYDKLDAVSFQNRAGQITNREFDSSGRLISIADPLGRRTRYEWCSCGALSKLVDPAGHVTEWHHDIQGRTIQKKYADGTEETYEYEPDTSRLSAKTDALKQRKTYSYNLDNSIAQIGYANTRNPTSPVHYSYHPDFAELISATNDFGAVKIEYSRIPGKTSGIGVSSIVSTGIPDSTISFEYAPSGSVKKRSVNGESNVVESKFDQIGRVVSDSSILGEFKYLYDDAINKDTLRLAKIIYPNRTETEFSYHGSSGLQQLHEIKNVKGPLELSAFEYRYDKAGQIVDWQERFEGTNPVLNSFSYDAAGQLKQALTHASPAEQLYKYQYDLASNRISDDYGDLSRSGEHNNLNELTKLSTTQPDESKSGNATQKTLNLTYDANGNVLTNGEKSYKWDAENRIVEIAHGSGKITTFKYDALGQRSQISEFENGKEMSTRYYIWCDGELTEERDASGKILRRMFRLGENVDGKNLFYLRDHLGSSRQITDEKGNVISRINYDPFGVISVNKGAILPSRQFSGYFTHERSNLSLTLFRAYDSQLGRWLSRDPSGEFGLQGKPKWPINLIKDELIASNLYAYVGNNAIQSFDPLGLQLEVAVPLETSPQQSDVTIVGVNQPIPRQFNIADPKSWFGNGLGLFNNINPGDPDYPGNKILPPSNIPPDSSKTGGFQSHINQNNSQNGSNTSGHGSNSLAPAGSIRIQDQFTGEWFDVDPKTGLRYPVCE